MKTSPRNDSKRQKTRQVLNGAKNEVHIGNSQSSNLYSKKNTLSSNDPKKRDDSFMGSQNNESEGGESGAFIMNHRILQNQEKKRNSIQQKIENMQIQQNHLFQKYSKQLSEKRQISLADQVKRYNQPDNQYTNQPSFMIQAKVSSNINHFY
mmetsp:Transcript_39232/g.37641  ORF Transcript_39232/g.37641 Transcript_39232/m.37641 type:complete len:152 (-) Transcript_39232:142-597(-)